MILLTVACIFCSFLQSHALDEYSTNNTFHFNHARFKRSAAAIPNDVEARVVVNKHNEFRSIIGDEGEEPIPSNMRYMSWDDGLAYTSLTYAVKCIWKHSEFSERVTSELNFINGENLWAGVGELATNFDPAYGIRRWFEEYKDYTFENNSCIPGRKCGHYTQVVWAKSYKVGCAWTFCSRLIAPDMELADAMYMVCQYAPGGNVEGEKLYKIGARCSDCGSFDTCPDNALCHNEKRDAVLSFGSSSSKVAGILSAIVVILFSALGAGYYVYSYHKAKALQVLSAFRKTRRVSSVAALVESKTSSARSGIEKRNSAEVANANGDDTISKGNQTRGARLASVQIETGAAC